MPLTQEALVRQLRSALSQFNVDISRYLGHSFSIGAVTTAAAVGLEDSIWPLAELDLPIVREVAP